MDRQAFKQRMQNLKSYRENNPGKGYWDWRNSLPDNLKYTDDTEYDMQAAYEAGAQPEYNHEDNSYHLPTRDPNTGLILKKSIHPTFWKGLTEDAKLGYDTYFLGDKVYTKHRSEGPLQAFVDGGEVGDEERQYLRNWYANRREYAKHNMPAMLKQLDDADIYINPDSRIRNIYSTPIVISNDKIKQASKQDRIGEYGGYYHPNEGVVLPSNYKQWKDREPLLHELNHVVNTFNTSIFRQVNEVLKDKQIIDRGQEVNRYLITPSEVQSRLMEFRKLNNLDPTKVYGIPDVREWRRAGKDANLLDTFDDNTVLELINTIAYTPNKKVQKAVDGGQTGDPEKERFYQATGRSSSGRPLEEGLKPVFSLEDAANMTPIGDAISAKDAYDAVKNRDWLGAGLAALTVIPFVPNTIKRVTPTVRRTGTDQIDRILRAQNKEAKMATRLNNETYNIAERLMDDPSYMRRAQQVKNKYGDDYTSIYADIINAYNESPELLPKAKGSLSLGEARGKMQTQGSATTRHKEGGDFPKIGEYDYMFNIDRGVPYGSTTHEINHFSDFLKNQSPDAVGSSNMYKWMRSAIKPYSDSVSKYFSSPTEQKAYSWSWSYRCK